MGLLRLFNLVALALSGAQLVTAVLVWNTGGEAALFISIAVPIDVPRSHVFMSYNFEASYRLPKKWRRHRHRHRYGNATAEQQHFEDYYENYDYEEMPHKRPKPTRKRKQQKQRKKKNKKKKKLRIDSRSHTDETLLSRRKLYAMLQRRLQDHNFGSGELCLLRLICESNAARLGEHNGVLGSLMQVMFSPSSSKDEQLPPRYYLAEQRGQRDECELYEQRCKRSLLDLITRPITHFINTKLLAIK